MARRGLIDRMRRRRTGGAPPRPTGTVTFVLTDIEGSTRLWETVPHVMERAIRRHGAIVAAAVAKHGGTLVRERGEGDSTFSVFPHAPAAVTAALELQAALTSEPWETGTELRVRVALHTGDAYLIDEQDYASPVINRCARIREVAYGGQVLVSEHTAAIVEQDLPDGATLRDLGPHRLRDLSRPVRIFQLQHPTLLEDFPRLRSLEAGLHNLPVQLTSFIGREREVEEVRKHLAATRVLNLTGPGGIGKTRLALQAAGELSEAYPDGIWFVDLSAVTDADLVPQAIAQALSLREERGRSVADSVIEHLRSAQALIAIDNVEHLVDAASSFATTLLRSCVELSILATGREPLHVPGATNWRVPAMAVPDDTTPTEALGTYESIRLFTERAGLVRPDFSLSHETGPIVARICRNLDGVPLAIELAAANVASMSVADIEARLDDRFRTLTRGGPDVPRHSTLLTTLDWSHDLLSEKERTLFRRLSVFAGGFSLPGAEEVCCEDPLVQDEIAFLLTNLVDKSLVVLDEVLNATRYAMLETIHDYATLKLTESGEDNRTQQRHASYYTALAARLAPAIEGPDEVDVLNELEVELPNLRHALSYLRDERSIDGLTLAISLRQFWSARGLLIEGREQISEAVASMPDVEANVRARALTAAGDLARQLGDLAESRRLLEESVELCRAAGDVPATSGALVGLANTLHASGEVARAEELYTEGLSLAREWGGDRNAASALTGLGIIALSSGNPAAAAPLYEEAVAILQRLGTRRVLAYALANLGMAKSAIGELASAKAVFEEGSHLAREVGDERLGGTFLNHLGDVLLNMGSVPSALEAFEEGLALHRRLNDQVGAAESAYRLAEGMRVSGRITDARRSYEEALATWRETGHAHGVGACFLGLALTDRLEGNLEDARRDIAEAVDRFRSLGQLDGLTYCIETLAGIALDEQRPEDAALLFGAAAAARERSGSTADPATAAQVARDIASARADVGDQPFDERWTEGTALSLDDAVGFATNR